MFSLRAVVLEVVERRREAHVDLVHDRDPKHREDERQVLPEGRRPEVIGAEVIADLHEHLEDQDGERADDHDPRHQEELTALLRLFQFFQRTR